MLNKREKATFARFKISAKFHRKLTVFDSFLKLQSFDWRIKDSDYYRLKNVLENYILNVLGWTRSGEQDAKGRIYYYNPVEPKAKPNTIGKGVMHPTSKYAQFVNAWLEND